MLRLYLVVQPNSIVVQQNFFTIGRFHDCKSLVNYFTKAARRACVFLKNKKISK